MKTITIGSFFVLFALVMGLTAANPVALADHSEVVIEPVAGSSISGCQEEGGCYNPMVATVDVGGVVIFSNTDLVAHTFTAGTMESGPTGEFDSGLSIPGSSFEYKADTVGEIPHFCIVHPWMTGLIIVQEAEARDEMKDKDEMKYNDEMKDKDGMMRMDAPSAEGMLSDGTMISVYAGEPMAGEQMKIKIKFIDAMHTNYDVTAMQNGETVLDDKGAHEHEGMGMHMTAPLPTSDPVDLTITFQGYGVDEITGPVGEVVTFTNIVPEFGTIAMMVLVVAIISIIAITSKSRVIPRL